MFYYLEGTVAHTEPYLTVIDCGGVGYLCHVTAMTQARIKQGQKARLFTHLNVREDAMELFGFATKQEREMFRRLCAVTGVGAKTALGILSALPLRDLSIAIVTGDIASLSRAPGIGKKTAQRIVLELKDKVDQQDVSLPKGEAAAAAPVPAGSIHREAQAALQALGYTSAEAARAINLVRDQADTVDQLILAAVRQMSSL